MKKLFSFFSKTWVWCILILVIAIGLRCYRFSDKNDLFSDEHMTIFLSNYNVYPWDEPYMNDSVPMMGEDITKLFLSDNNSLSSVFGDIKKLRYINRDAPQTNLYYSFFRLSTLGADTDTDTINIYMQRGFALNIILFIISFVLLYLLAKRLFNTPILIICTLAVAFITPASIGNTLFLRPYQMQETLLIAFSYLFVRYSLLVFERKRIDTWQNLLIISGVTALVLLSGYFAIFYVLILGAVLVYFLIRNGQQKTISFMFFALVLAYIFCLVFYVGYNNAFSYERGPEAMDKISASGFTDNILLSISGLWHEISSFFFSIPLIIVLLLIIGYIIFNRRKITISQNTAFYLPLIVALCGLAWTFVAFFFAPYKIMRYIMPVLPLVALIVPFLLSYLDHKKQIVLTATITILVLGHSLLQANIYWSLKPVEKEYVSNPQAPMIVGGLGRWEQVPLIPYFTPGRVIEFSFSPDDFVSKIEKYNEMYVFIQYNEKNRFTLPKGYKADYRSNMGRIPIEYYDQQLYYVYKLTKE